MKLSKKAIMIISGILGVLVLLGVVLIGASAFIYWNKSNSTAQAASSKYTDFCSQQNNFQQGGNRPEGTPPAGFFDGNTDNSTRPTPPEGFQDMRTKVTEICSDGVVSDSEASELDQLFPNGFTPGQGRGSLGRQGGTTN